MENNIDICLLNETFLKNTSPPLKFTGFNCINKNAKNEHGGVAIIIKNSLKYKIINTPFYEDIQSLAISVETKAGPISIACFYCPPRTNRFRVNKLNTIINSLPKPCFISGDFNAHHLAFGCTTSNARGNALYGVFDEQDLCILNTGNITTVQRPTRNASAIDISCASPVIAPLCEWHVGNDSLGSDHYPTFVNMNISPHFYKVNYNIEKFLFHKADWSKYFLLSEELCEGFQVHIDNPIESYNKFCEILNTLKVQCIPIYKGDGIGRMMRAPAPWWNNECDEAVKNAKEALLKYRLEFTIESFIEYKRINAVKKLVLKEAKKSSWKVLCTSLNRYTPITKIWNYVRRFKRIHVNRNQYRNDEWIPDFIAKLSKASESNIDRNNFSNIFASESNITESDFISKPFTYDELCIALETRKNTTPGLDDFPYMMLKKLHSSGRLHLLNIYNSLWQKKLVPESWKTQCVIPILKPNKQPDDYNSYRPISLASCIGKLFEQMIKLRLDYFVEKNKLLPDFQFGFRKGKSSTDSFVLFTADIKKCLLSHSSAVCAFLDVQGAYDNVDLCQLIRVLHDIGLPGKLLNWIYEFCFNRTMFVRFNNILHGPCSVGKGLMQGSSLSPLLYNLYTSQICKYVNTDVSMLQFADDILVYKIHKDVTVAQHTINETLQQLNTYYSNLKLNINSQKSSVLVFGSDVPVNIVYNNTTIPQVRSQKFLGVILDDKLKFDKHVNYICQNAMKGINIMRCITGVFWGSDPKTLSMIYKSIVRSHFEYSSLAYLNASPTLLKKLDVLQNIGLRLISGAMRTTPINVMEAETCIEPLVIRRLSAAQRFSIKTLSQSNSIVLNSLSLPEAWSRTLQDFSLKPSDIMSNRLPAINTILSKVKENSVNMYKSDLWPVYRCAYDALVYTKVKMDLRKIEDKFMFMEQMEENNDKYIIYTDGSKSSSGVKSAYYDPQLRITKTFKIDSFCSIFSAEAYAVYRALLHIQSITNEKFIIISDSLSVLVGLQRPNFSYKQNHILLDIRYMLLVLRNSYKNVEFKWVPSHNDIEGNEIVDRAANAEPDEDLSEVLRVPFTDYHVLYNEKKRDIWKEYWIEISKVKGQWYFNIQKELPVKPWFNKHKDIDERKFITIINRMRFGHCLTPAHLHRMKIVNSKECEYCGHENADLHHLILDCQYFSLQRLLMITELLDINPDVPRRLQELLSDTNLFGSLYRYVLNTVDTL